MPLYRTHDDDLIAELGELHAALREQRRRGQVRRAPLPLRPRKRPSGHRHTLRAA